MFRTYSWRCCCEVWSDTVTERDTSAYIVPTIITFTPPTIPPTLPLYNHYLPLKLFILSFFFVQYYLNKTLSFSSFIISPMIRLSSCWNCSTVLTSYTKVHVKATVSFNNLTTFRNFVSRVEYKFKWKWWRDDVTERFLASTSSK